MATFVLVHGSSGGGWVWQKLTPLLRAAGHEVYAPTLTGLSDRSHLLHCGVDLTTHITDVANLLFYEDLSEVVLVGNSYAGMVITGVAAKAPERLKLLVYLDAYVPEDGQSEADLWPPERRAIAVAAEAATRGLAQPPPPALFGVTDPAVVEWLQARMTPQPVTTYTEPVPPGNARSAAIPRVFIYCTGNPASTPDIFGPFANRARAAGWDVHQLATGHLAMLTAPHVLAELLLQLGGRTLGNDKSRPRPVVFLPGGIVPAARQYESLLNMLKDEIQPVLKDAEVFAGDSPPSDYGLDMEFEGIRRAAEAAGVTSFHLVEYSNGLSLAFTAKYPEMVRSLALIEPGWIPAARWKSQESEYWTELQRVMRLPPGERFRAGMRMNMRPGAEAPAPPPGPPPAWMEKRVEGGATMFWAFNAYDFELEHLKRFVRPVYLALGSMTAPIFERNAKLLANIFPNLRLEIYEGLQHLNPPQQAEPHRLAQALRDLWASQDDVIS